MKGWAYIPENEVVNPVERPVPKGTHRTRRGRPVRQPQRFDEDESGRLSPSAFLTYEGPKGREAYLASEFVLATTLGDLDDDDEPKSVTAALTGANGDEWLKAMESENRQHRVKRDLERDQLTS